MRNILASLIIILAAVALYLDFGPKPVTGRVVDASGKGVPAVTVKALQKSWKWDKRLITNQDYFYTTQTDSEGKFKLMYTRGGPGVHLLFYKGERDPNFKKFDIYFWERPVVRYP